jgi:molybdopterin synthase sulfur carrier subunit
MPLVRFTQNIQRHVSCPPSEARGSTVRDALESYFASHANVRGYVLDDQGSLRRHMVVFVNGRTVQDRVKLSDPIEPGSTIDVMQALSGG